MAALTNKGSTLDFNAESFGFAFKSICEDGLIEFMTNLFGALKNTTGLSSISITTTFGSGIMPLPEKKTFEGVNTLLSPDRILLVLSRSPCL